MDRIGYDAVNVGEKELAGGIAAFQELVSGSGLPITSASFVYRESGAPLFAPYLVKTYEAAGGRNVKVAYVGINSLNSSFAKGAGDDRVVVLRDPVEAARAAVPAARKEADLVVLLANISLRDLSGLLGSVQGVDLVLASYGTRLSIGGRLEEIGGVPVFYAGHQGQRLGEVRISLPAGGPPSMTANHIWLTKSYPAEPEMEKMVQETIAKVNDLNRRHAEAEVEASDRGSPHDPQALASNSPYETVSKCVSCHEEAYKIYTASRHARAFDTLVRANQDFNDDCVRCHVTGFGVDGGWLNARQTPQLVNVQCEACHGAGEEHLASPEASFGKVAPRQCFSCHTKENSPEFSFFQYWAKIKH